jgi:hypothetical protein
MNQRIAPAANETAPAQAHGQTVRLTAAQALVRYLAAQRVACEDGSGRTEPLFGGACRSVICRRVAGSQFRSSSRQRKERSDSPFRSMLSGHGPQVSSVRPLLIAEIPGRGNAPAHKFGERL